MVGVAGSCSGQGQLVFTAIVSGVTHHVSALNNNIEEGVCHISRENVGRGTNEEVFEGC